MHGYIKRVRLQNRLREALKNFPATAVLGARQTGKTVLAKEILADRSDAVYLDLQLPSDFNKLSDPEAFFQFHRDKLICLDEIQVKPDLFSVLRAVIDQRRRNGRFLILGSASRDLISRSGESLAGRIAFLDTAPFDLEEAGEGLFYQHWLRGGYPLSFLAKSDSLSLDWRRQYIRSFLERDIPQLGLNISSPLIERLWRMLAHLQGQTLNSSKLGNSLGKTSHTVKNYIDILERSFVLRSLRPHIRNIKKRLIKSPKIYIRDTGLLHALLDIETGDDLFGHPVYGGSFESYVVENICYRAPDWRAGFYRAASGAELDLVLEKAGQTIAVEIKASKAPKPSRGFWRAALDVKADKKYIIAPVKTAYPVQNDAVVTPVRGFLQDLSAS